MVNNLKRKDRSVKQDVFWVLHHSYMPSVLIELGFLTNNNEGPYVNSKKGRREMAKEVANGIITYRKNIALASSSAQNRIITEQQNKDTAQATEKNIFEGVDFKVQIAASSKKLETKSYNFNGLSEISRYPEDNMFKYYYGSTSDYSKILSMREFAKQKGYSTCYIVAFKNGEKVKLADVLKSEDK
jgi:N-acetylmuramoyl-L-alanine amidase